MKGKTDIFIMIPVNGIFQEKNRNVQERDKDIQEFLKQLDETSLYECSPRIAHTLKRYYLGNVEIAYTSDEYDMDTAEWVKGALVLTYQGSTELGVAQIILPRCDKDPTQIGDIVSTGHIRLRNEGTEYMLRDYLMQQYRLELCGKCRCIYCLPMAEKQENELEYLLAGETMNSEHVDYKMENMSIRDSAQKDISVYDFYELYASQSSLVYYTYDFSDNFSENIEKAVVLIFICEIAILQNAAIVRINNQIIGELMENSDISAKKTLKLQVEFGRTIVLWERNIYNYENVQILSNRIIEAFGTNELFQEYQRNKEHIEQIASVKSGIAAELEGKVLNGLALILSVAELVQLGELVVNFLRGNSNPYFWGGAGGGCLILLLVLVIRRARKKNKSKCRPCY